MSKPAPQPRTDGWTPARQLTFLGALAATRSVTKAARAAGMSRESAHRLRARDPNGLLAALWDLALASRPPEGHTRPLTDGRLTRLRGNHNRRESGNFFPSAPAAADAPPPHPTRTL